MSTVKIFSPGDWSDLPEEQHQVKIASTGLGFNDRKDAENFADPEMLHWISKVSTHPDCFYVYKTAMGGSHRYGPNRWGDGFREEVLDRDCKTFEQGAKAYRQHRSDGPFYGQVKLARLQKKLGHVDLVTEYFGTDSVAAKFGGLMADKEIETLEKLGHIPVSMGSLVPGDECSQCGHWAPKPKDRCLSKKEGGSCTLFGCKTGMLKVASDGRMNFVDNPKNTFYDISMVGTGADPIAYGLLLPIGDFRSKQAGMVKIAEYVHQHVNSDLALSELEREGLELGYHFSALESKAASFDAEELDPGYASHRSNPSGMQGLRFRDKQQYRDAVSGLIAQRELPDFVSFAKSAGLNDAQIEHAEQFIPNLFTRLVRHSQLVPILKRACLFEFSGKNANDVFAMSTLKGIDSQSVIRRTLQANAECKVPMPRKVASLEAPIPHIATEYAALKLAFFVARKTVEPQVLYGVTRRDFFKGNVDER